MSRFKLGNLPYSLTTDLILMALNCVPDMSQALFMVEQGVSVCLASKNSSRGGADKIYRNRNNQRYCREHGIRMNGPKLGRPPKDKELYEEQKRLERIESRERNAIEAKIR